MPRPRTVERPPFERISNLINEAEPYHEPGVVWQSKTRENAQIRRGSMTIVCGGRHGELLGQSLKLAQEICSTEFREKDPWPYNPEEVILKPKVLYINTATTRDSIANQAMGLWSGAQEWCVKRDRYLRDNPAKDDNLFLYHVPAGEFNKHYPEIKIQRKQTMASVVILNSFEFACRTARHRDDLIFQLLELREMGCTIIIFTQDEKRRVEKQARGPLALLRMQSDQVLDHSVFEELVYAEPVGSTHKNEQEYYESTGECGLEYFRRIREMSSTEYVQKEDELPDRVTAEEIKDNIHDDIDLPQELVDGGVYSMDGELICVNEGATLQTMNRYTVHRNAYEPSPVAGRFPPLVEKGSTVSAC
jgi:hypothetical protein